MNLKSALLQNMGVKLIAVAVALVIWFNVSSQEQMTRLFNLPIKLVNLPDSLTITGQVPKELEVSVTATKRQLLYMSFKKAYVAINLSNATTGHLRQTVSTSNLMLPSGINLNDVRIISPTSLDLFFEERVKRVIPVSLVLQGSVPDGYLLDRPPSVEPKEVEVTGGKSIVAHLKTIPTKPVSLSKIRDSFEKDVELDFDRESLRCNPEEVRISIGVSQKKTRVLANIPPTILFDESGMYAEVDPKAVSLTVEGPKTILDTLSSRDVSILIDLSGKRPGAYTLAPEVIVPAGLKSIALDVDSLRVKLKLLKSKRSSK